MPWKTDQDYAWKKTRSRVDSKIEKVNGSRTPQSMNITAEDK